MYYNRNYISKQNSIANSLVVENMLRFYETGELKPDRGSTNYTGLMIFIKPL